MQKKQNVNLLIFGKRGLAYGSIVGLVLLLSLMLFPVSRAQSSALGEDQTLTSSLNTKTTAYLYSTLTLSTSGQVDIDIKPKAAGSLEIGTAEVKVATNNTTGYSMFLSTVDQTNRLNQIDSKMQYSGEGASDYYIDALSGSVAAEDYLKSNHNLNTWGYALTTGEANGSTEYRGIDSSSGDQIYTTTSTTSNDSYKLNVAVAVDTSLPAGGYRNGLVITAVANPIVLSGFNQIYYMQDMTPEVCESAEMESTAQLVDKRDNRLYTVTKFKDDNCWLTDNLNFVITEEMANATGENGLSSETTDIGYDDSGNLINGIKYWNRESEVPPLATYLTNDAVVSDYTLARSWNLGDAKSGSYFSFSAATAGSGTGLSYKTAPDSICPKGWKLPRSGASDPAISKSYVYLFEAYNAWGDVEDKFLATSAPLNFWKGGEFRDERTDWGGGGYYWTSDALGIDAARGLYINRAGIAGHVAGSSKAYGKTVRCVAR